jgi:hypothetical protein
MPEKDPYKNVSFFKPWKYNLNTFISTVVNDIIHVYISAVLHEADRQGPRSLASGILKGREGEREGDILSPID